MMRNSKLLGFSGLVVCWIMMVLTCNIAFAQNGQALGVKPSERVIPANAPRVRGEVEPDSIGIGDRFRYSIEVEKDLMQEVYFPTFGGGEVGETLRALATACAPNSTFTIR
jgi:hypothetical protein